VRWNVRGHRPKQGGLPGTDAAADDARAPSEHRRSAKGTKGGIEGPHLDEVVGGDPEITMPADRERRTGRDRHHCEQPRAIGQLEGKPRRAEVEASLTDARTRADRPQHLDHLVVGVRDRLDAFVATVCVTDPDDIAAVRVDVLDGWIVKEVLEPVKAEECVEYGAGEFVLFLGGHERGPDGESLSGATLQRLGDQLSPKRLLVTGPESRPAAIG
jgi:hypothetical protein